MRKRNAYLHPRTRPRVGVSRRAQLPTGPVSPPPAGRIIRGWCIVDWLAVLDGGLIEPNRKRNLTIGTKSIASLGRMDPELVREVE